MKETTIDVQDLDRLERVAADTKKGFTCDKGEDAWSWFNRGDEETKHGGFKTRLAALQDAVGPYFDKDSEEAVDVLISVGTCVYEFNGRDSGAVHRVISLAVDMLGVPDVEKV